MSTDSKSSEPTLYLYKCCPFCVRAQLMLGLKDVPHKLEYLDNHDEKAHIDKIGVKMVPILEFAPGKFMGESLDIVHYVDKHYGGDAILKPVPADQKEVSDALGKFSMPFGLTMPLLLAQAAHFPELTKKEARDYFIEKKSALLKSTMEEASAKKSEFLAMANESAAAIAPLVKSEKGIYGDFVTVDDIMLAARLWTSTIVKDFKLPSNLQAYLDHYLKRGKVEAMPAI